MRKSAIFLLLVLAAQNQWAGCAFTDSGPPRAVAGRLLVKLTPKAAKEVAEARGEQGQLSPDQLPIKALRRLSRQYRVTGWRPLFPHPKVPGLILAPKRDDSTGLNRIYLLTCDPSTDIPAAARDFGRFSEWVEYAEPDRVVEIQPTP